MMSEIQEGRLGPNHPDVARALTNPAIAPRPSAAGGMGVLIPAGGRDVAPIGALLQVPRAPRPAWCTSRGGLPALYQYGTGPVGLHLAELYAYQAKYDEAKPLKARAASSAQPPAAPGASSH